ncbi:MAG: hypothetical protein MMC23_010010 [Stictis urceolatum]|nr:hypothetical protein [Stictis urceolata]
MQTPAPSNSRKRRRSDQYPREAEEEAFQIASKKHKAIHTPDPSQPATQQDDPSPILLKRDTLRVLRRQYTQAARESRANPRPRRPATRLANAEWQRRHPPLKPARTYLKHCRHEQYRALQSFARHGGPDLRELRGCQRAALCVSKNPMAPSQASYTSRSRDRRLSRTKSTTEGGTSRSKSTYNRAFQQVLIDYNVYPPHYKHSDGRAAPKPENWDDINKRLAQSRASLSPSKFSRKEHEDFVDKDASVAKESQVKKQVIPIIEGTIKDARNASGEIPFTNLDPLAADEHLASSVPDFYCGARAEDLERQIRVNDLLHKVVPSTQHDLPILPNHFLAAKGPDGTAAVAVRQATYDAYFGARGMQDIHDYGRAEPQFDNKAYTFSHIYSDGQLQLFTSHPVKPSTAGGRPSYYMNLLRSFSMRDSPVTWREGATHYRNSLDLAEEFRNESIRGANEVFANRARLELDQLTVESQGQTAPSDSGEEFETAAEEEQEEGKGAEVAEVAEEEEEDDDDDEEVRSSLPVSAKRSRSRRQTDSRRKRRNREDSEDSEGIGSTPLSSQSVIPQASSSAGKKRKGKGKVLSDKKLVR